MVRKYSAHLWKNCHAALTLMLLPTGSLPRSICSLHSTWGGHKEPNVMLLAGVLLDVIIAVLSLWPFFRKQNYSSRYICNSEIHQTKSTPLSRILLAIQYKPPLSLYMRSALWLRTVQMTACIQEFHWLPLSPACSKHLLNSTLIVSFSIPKARIMKKNNTP